MQLLSKHKGQVTYLRGPHNSGIWVTAPDVPLRGTTALLNPDPANPGSSAAELCHPLLVCSGTGVLEGGIVGKKSRYSQRGV